MTGEVLQGYLGFEPNDENNQKGIITEGPNLKSTAPVRMYLKSTDICHVRCPAGSKY